MRFLAALGLAPVLLWAQLELSLVRGEAEQPVREVADLGAVDASDVLDARFRVRNAGKVAAVVHTVQVAGFGFTRKDAPALPANLSPGAVLEFSVRLTPSGAGAYSAVLTVNTVAVLLRARVTAGPVLSLQEAHGWMPLRSADTVDFGKTEVGGSASRRFRIENPYADPVEVAEVAVQGEAFRLVAGFDLPRRIDAGESAVIEVVFQPPSAGTHGGRLVMNGRTFALSGAATEAPPPRPEISLDPTPPRSGQQVRLRIRLAERARSAGRGELRVEFQPAAPGWPDDPAIGFLSPPGRSLPFSVERGADAGHFDGGEEVVLQTGTTAGRLILRAELGPHVTHAELVLVPQPVVVDAVRVERRAGGLELYLAGFDNSRSVSQLTFTFYGSNGQVLDPGPVALDAAAEFRRYFESATLGGLFALRAAFPVTGDVAQVRAVEIEIRNSVGVTRTPRVTF